MIVVVEAATAALEIDIPGKNAEPVWSVALATSITIILLHKLGVGVEVLVLRWGKEEEKNEGPDNKNIAFPLRLHLRGGVSLKRGGFATTNPPIPQKREGRW